LAYVLWNRLYLGEINYRGKSYPAEHSLFDAVQAKLDENKLARRGKSERSPSAAAWLAL
jgi:hypothetical protein